MQGRQLYKPMARAVAIILLTFGLLSGVTYAALQSQAKFIGSSIETATANLLISLNGTNYSTSQQGFTFGNVIPGGSLSPSNGYQFHLKNGGGTHVTLKLAVSSLPTNVENVDLTKVNVILTPASGGQPQTFTLQSLIDSQATGGVALTGYAVLMAGTSQQFGLQVSMAKEAMSGSSASIGGIDFVFTGTAAI